MTTRISQLGDISTVQGNVLVPLVSNITGNLTTVKGTVDTLKAFIVAATEANIITANIGMKGYVDSVTTAWTANAVQQLNDLGNLYANASSQQSALNSLLANAGSQSDLIIGINANVTAANLGMIGYVDNKVSTANIGMIGYVDNKVSTANIGIKGYIDNSTLTANIGMKGYVDSVASQSIYSNSNVASYLTTYSGNIANIRLGVNGVLTFSDGTTMITAASGSGSSNYSNVNVKAYTESMGYQNFGNSNVASYLPTYSGNLTADSVEFNFLTVSDGPTGINSLSVGVPGISPFGNAIASFHGNINAPSHINVHNKNSGDRSLSGFVATAYSTTEPEAYNATLQVTGEGWNVPAIALVKPYDTIVGSVGGNLNILAHDKDFSAPSKDIVLALGYNPTYEKVRISNSSVTITGANLTVGDILVNGNITGSVNGYSIGYRDVPQITVANLTLIASDAGKHYYGANTNPTTITIPTNANVAFGNGTAISIVNQGTGNITVANAAGVLLYLAGNSTAGSRTLTSYGMATLIKVQVNTWFINGTGVV